MQKKTTFTILKRTIFITTLFVFSISPLCAQSIGDVNNDSNIDIVDGLLLSQYYVGLSPEPFYPAAADVNCDNRIDILDALLVAQLYVGLIDAFPCTEPTPTATPQSTIEPTPVPGTSPFSDELLIRWGLGTPLTEYYENDRDYPWYMDQYNTGTYSSINCGPTSVTMAIKWTDESFDRTPENARETYRPDGGWWYTSDIINYLNAYNTEHIVITAANDPNLFKDQLRGGNILILCITMEEIRRNSVEREHTHAFFSGTGHFIVIKGYIVVNNTLYFEAYDPNSLNRFYPAPEETWLKGKDRYYLWEDLYNAVSAWWNYAIVVMGNSGLRSNSRFITQPVSVDPNTIPHKSGAGY
ncbi:MAG: hypothetical protein JXJ04_17320 [Spirochaetales bacterium]|nr:hypothetical protein [Spirochaetales bacterium]